MITLKKLFSRLQRFAERPLNQKLLLVEAYALLFLARLAVKTLPFKYVARWCGTEGVELDSGKVPAKALQSVRWAVRTSSRYGLWNCKCLTQALAAKAMLRRRGLRSTMYLGLTRPGEVDFSAHAWLVCGGAILTGAKGHEQFHVVAKFTEPNFGFQATEL